MKSRPEPVRPKDTSPPAQAIRRARSEERLRNAHVLNGLRAAAAASLGVVFFVARSTGFDAWRGADVVCGVWAAIALAVAGAGIRWRTVAVRSGLAFPLLDVPAIVAIQMAVLPAMPDDVRVIMMATTPLALLIIGSTFWLEPWLIWLTAGLSAGSQALLLVNHDAGIAPVLITVVTLAMTATATSFGASRIRALNESTTKYLSDLQLVEEGFRDLISHSPDGIMVQRDGIVLYANAQLAAILRAASPQALRDRTVASLIHVDDRERVAARVTHVIEDGMASAPTELHLVGADGRVIPAEVRDVIIQFGDAPAVLTVVRDLTGVKQMQERLIVSDRMASMGTLAAGVAHEINNPLTAVVGHLDLLDAELGENGENGDTGAESGGGAGRVREALREALPDMREAVTRVRDIVRDLNLFSRARQGPPGAVDVRKVVDSSLRMAANEIRHRARLERDFHDVPLVAGSEARLGQVFLNLAVNAAQAIPEGDAAHNTIRVKIHPGADATVVVEVSDTGAGMSPDLQRRIFDPFFTTKPAGLGTGLGLAICHRIISEIGGQINVESETGRGTTFRVILPAAANPAPDVGTPRAATAATERRCRILVVDDEALVVNTICRVLGGVHDVTGTTDAADALRRLLAGERFDVILCDLMMPRVTGMDLYSEVRLASPEQASRIIFLTGGAFTERAQKFLLDVPNLRVDKPFDAAALRALVSHALR